MNHRGHILSYFVMAAGLAFSILLPACGKGNGSPTAMLRETERILGAEFPSHTALHVESPTEFCYVGKMHVRRSEAEPFLAKLKFSSRPQFQFLTTWGKYRELFNAPERTVGFVGATGVIEGRNSWELAYDPASEQLWFFMGFALKPPPVLSDKTPP